MLAYSFLMFFNAKFPFRPLAVHSPRFVVVVRSHCIVSAPVFFKPIVLVGLCKVKYIKHYQAAFSNKRFLGHVLGLLETFRDDVWN